jgi:putative transposase
MPDGLVRKQQCGDLHFITFSCYHRQAFLASTRAKSFFEGALEKARLRYHFLVVGYGVMPEHVHLLLSEPERGRLCSAIQSIKQSASRKFIAREGHFWQERYYDFNVYTVKKRIEKLRYIHRNPVERGLVARPEDWPWSSFLHYATGEPGVIEVESFWTEIKRERSGIVLKLPRTPALAQNQG